MSRNWKMIPVLPVIWIMFASIMPAALAEPVDNDLQMWNTVTLTLPVSDKVDTFVQFQPRLKNNLTTMDRSLLWGGVGYKIRPNLSIWQGYAWTPTYPNVPGNRLNNENRLWQQLLYTKKIKGGKLMARSRVEERLIENTGTSVWTRHLIQYSHPIKETRFYLVGSDEIFIDLNSLKGGPQRGFDQNRAFIGIGRKLNQHTSMELGYMGAYVNKPSAHDQWGHIIFTQLLIN